MLTYTSKIGATCAGQNFVVLAPGASTCCSGSSTCTSSSW